MKDEGHHLGEEFYRLHTSILCFENILSLPNSRFYSKETREYYRKGLVSAQRQQLKFQHEYSLFSSRKQEETLDISRLSNIAELRYQRRVILTANDNYYDLRSPPVLYGSGTIMIDNLNAQRNKLFKKSLNQSISDYNRARLRYRIRAIDRCLLGRKDLSVDKVGVIQPVRIFDSIKLLSALNAYTLE